MVAGGSPLVPPPPEFGSHVTTGPSKTITFSLLSKSSPKTNSSRVTNLGIANLLEEGELPPPPLSLADIVKGKSSSLYQEGQTVVSDFTRLPISGYQGKPAVTISSTEISKLVAKLPFVLIGKFTHGRPSMVAIKDFFHNLKLKGYLNISYYDKKHILLECSCKEDFINLWLKLVVNIHGFALRIFKWEKTFKPSMETSTAPVWIRLEGLPLYLFDANIICAIANTVGPPLRLDPRTLDRSILSSARICVEIDVAQTCTDAIWINIVDEGSNELSDGFWISVKYDYIPLFCQVCSHIGHGAVNCKTLSAVQVFDDLPQTTSVSILAGRECKDKSLMGGEQGCLSECTKGAMSANGQEFVADVAAVSRVTFKQKCTSAAAPGLAAKPAEMENSVEEKEVLSQNWSVVTGTKSLKSTKLSNDLQAQALPTENKFSSLMSQSAINSDRVVDLVVSKGGDIAGGIVPVAANVAAVIVQQTLKARAGSSEGVSTDISGSVRFQLPGAENAPTVKGKSSGSHPGGPAWISGFVVPDFPVGFLKEPPGIEEALRQYEQLKNSYTLQTMENRDTMESTSSATEQATSSSADTVALAAVPIGITAREDPVEAIAQAGLQIATESKVNQQKEAETEEIMQISAPAGPLVDVSTVPVEASVTEVLQIESVLQQVSGDKLIRRSFSPTGRRSSKLNSLLKKVEKIQSCEEQIYFRNIKAYSKEFHAEVEKANRADSFYPEVKQPFLKDLEDIEVYEEDLHTEEEPELKDLDTEEEPEPKDQRDTPGGYPTGPRQTRPKRNRGRNRNYVTTGKPRYRGPGHF